MSRAKEFVELVGEVAREFEAQQMEAWATPEVIQKIATSLFIDGNIKSQPRAGAGGFNRSSSPSQSSGDTETLIGTVEEKESKTIDTSRGKGKKYAIKVGGRWFSTFNAKAFAGTAIEEGDEVKVYFKMNGKYANLEKVEAVGPVSDEAEGEEIPF